MPKMKTNKAIAKRVKITGRGKIMRNKAGSGHLRSHKSPKQLRDFRKARPLSPAFTRRVKHLLGI
jgi:large subunit ribosomal protein L35